MPSKQVTPRRQVLVRTYSPTSNANYGGILQAWALQTALTEFDLDVWTDSTYVDTPSFARLRLAFRNLQLRLAPWLPSRMLRAHDLGQRLIDHERNRAVLRFSKERVRTVRLFRGRGRIASSLLHKFDAFIVGSDQIWRPDYTSVPSFMLDFVPDTFRGPRVAYAASFGKFDPTLFSGELLATTLRLSSQFTAISVREPNGVAIAERLWGIRPAQMPDPTLLPTKAQYLDLIGGPASTDSTVATYILDSRPEDALWRTTLARAGEFYRDLNPPFPSGIEEFRAEPGRFVKTTIEGWLKGIATSRFVVTDSFHGCLFAIVFNRPFVVLPNDHRGIDRISGLLALCGLQDRLLPFRTWSPTEDEARRVRSASIDWEAVNRRLAAERERGQAFLRSALTGEVDAFPRVIQPEAAAGRHV